MQAKVIYRVDDVQLVILKSKPPALVITAYGTASTPGWTEAQLVPYVYVQFPPDGIWDFSFIAKAPTGNVPQVLTPIAATYTWHDFPEGKLKGVRIHASSNEMEQLIAGAPSRTFAGDVSAAAAR